MFGDQGFFERGHNVSFSRSREADLVERLDGVVSIPQEWHKKKVRYFFGRHYRSPSERDEKLHYDHVLKQHRWLDLLTMKAVGIVT